MSIDKTLRELVPHLERCIELADRLRQQTGDREALELTGALRGLLMTITLVYRRDEDGRTESSSAEHTGDRSGRHHRKRSHR